MGYYYTTDGERITQQTLDRRIDRAKDQKRIERLGLAYCEWCGRNNSQLHMAHIISVQKCKNNREADMAYDMANIKLLCDECHRSHDKL